MVAIENEKNIITDKAPTTHVHNQILDKIDSMGRNMNKTFKLGRYLIKSSGRGGLPRDTLQNGETKENEESQSDANSQDEPVLLEEYATAPSTKRQDEPVVLEQFARAPSTNSQDGPVVLEQFAKAPSTNCQDEPVVLEQSAKAPSTSAARGSVSRVATPYSLPVHELGAHTFEMPSTSAAREGLTRAEIPSAVMSEPELAEMASASTTQERVRRTLTTNEMEHAANEDSYLETLREENITHSVSRGYITFTAQCNKSDNSTVKFEGLDIRSNLLHTLQNIWSKHGNLIENSIIRNGDMVARALESLATVVLILEETSVRCLSDSQVDYLNATLSDLQCMHFKVDWLVPCVEKAAQLHKSKPLIDSCNEIQRCRAKVVERRAKLMEELAEVDKLENELKEDVANASRLIPFSGNVDLDQPVGWKFS